MNTSTTNWWYRDARQRNAENLYGLLRAANVSDRIYFDGVSTVIVADIRCYFTAVDVEIRFPDPYGDPDDDLPVVVRVASSYLYTATATIVEGLVKQLYTSTSTSTADTPRCCGTPMTDEGPQAQWFHDESRLVYRSFSCGSCDSVTSVTVTDPDEATRLLPEVAP